MKPQTPAEGILLHKDYGDSVMYTVACECSDPNHAHQIWVEAEDIGVTVTTYTQQKTKWWEASRWRTIWTLLTRGYVEYEATLIMTEQQALNYGSTLIKSVSDCKQFRSNKK